MDKTKKAWSNAILLAVTLVINTLGAIGFINGLSQKQISDMYVTLITPSPSTFSIWGVIYSLLIGCQHFSGHVLSDTHKKLFRVMV